jgi:hypothetical protein
MILSAGATQASYQILVNSYIQQLSFIYPVVLLIEAILYCENLTTDAIVDLFSVTNIEMYASFDGSFCSNLINSQQNNKKRGAFYYFQ